MPMFSQLLRFHVRDKLGRSTRLRDLAVTLSEGDYPVITHLIFHDRHRYERVLPWQSVQTLDWKNAEIHVVDLEAGENDTAIPAENPLLLRDILDARIIDLQNRRVTRANDLSLEEEDGRLVLCAADIGARAFVRRLTRGRLGAPKKRHLADWKYIEFLRGKPRSAAAGAAYHMRIQRLPAGEIASLSEQLPYLHAAELLELLPDPLAADVLESLQPARRLQVFEELDEAQGCRLLGLMAPDMAADLVGHLAPETARLYLNLLPQAQGTRILDLLRFPEDTAGGIMTNSVICLPASMTLREAGIELQKQIKGPDFIFFIYIVNNWTERRLCGVMTLRHFFMETQDAHLAEVMNPYALSVSALEPARDAAYQVLNSGLAALPVIGRKGQLLGAVTVDAAVALVAPSSWSAQAPHIFS